MEVIDLDEARLVGRGCRRLVYEHPGDPTRCIKVQTAEAMAQLHRQKAVEREVAYLKLYARQGRSLEQVSRYHGTVATSAGEGHVFDLIRNHDGTIAPTLSTYLEESGGQLAELESELDKLLDYLRREAIIVADLHAGNVVRREGGPGRHDLVVIDGIGNTEFIKVHDYLRVLGRRKVQRKWDRFRRGLERDHGAGLAPCKER